MPIALQNRVAIPMASPAQASMLAAPGAAMLAIRYTRQTENNWCWAACGEMLFGQPGLPHLSQCDFASRQFSLACCPSPGAPPACDLGCWPHTCYPRFGLPTAMVIGALSRAQVQGELNAGRAVQACYQWRGGNTTHVALIVGEHANGDFEVFDPKYGAGARTYNQILGAYGYGAWIRSFTF